MKSDYRCAAEALALPEEEREACPRTQLFKDVLYGKDISRQLRCLTPVCSECKGIVYCKCEAVAPASTTNPWNPWAHGPTSKNKSPPPPPPGMVAVQQLRLTSSQYQDDAPVVVKKARLDLAVASPAGGSSSRDGPAPLMRWPHRWPMEQHGFSGGQTDWKAVRALLDNKVLRLERCMPMFVNALEDPHISVWLPRDTHVVRHIKEVIASLSLEMMFKIGVTVCPVHRYREASYAYSKVHAQQRDGVCYEGMIIVYVHPVRDVICIFETCLICYCKGARLLSNRVANVKEDFDNHIKCDDSDEEAAAASGPHVLYIVWGKRRPKLR
jgi:hypothetical protein